MRRYVPSGPRARSPSRQWRGDRESRLGSRQTSAPPYAARNREGSASASASASASVSDWRRMRAAKASGAPLRYYGGKTAEADEKRGVVKDIEGRAAAQDFSGEEPRDLGADHAVCSICPHACALAEGQTGLCRARVAEGGQVVDADYGRITSLALDPHREEAAGPLSPWKQGALRRFLRLQPALPVLPERFHRLRRRARRALARNRTGRVGRHAARIACDRGNIGLAFTYNEPLVGLEFVPRHRAPRPRAWPGQRAGIQRLRERRPAARGGTVHRCREHRPEGLHPELLRPRRRRLGNCEAHHRSAGCHTQLSPGSDDARHPRA